jgi:hypothetical protein
MKYLCKTYLTNCNFVLIILKLLTINKKEMQYTYLKKSIIMPGWIITLLYTGVTKEKFFTLVKLMKIENTFSFQLDVADQLLLVLIKLIFNYARVNYNTHYPSPLFYFYFRDLLVCSTARIVSRGNQTTKPWSFSARTGIHELYILRKRNFLLWLN